MNTLDEAWRWYQVTEANVSRMKRFARKYWLQPPWDELLSRDDHFNCLEADQVKHEAEFSLEHLNDLAVVVLFSVFEATVRERVLEKMRPEAALLQQPALIQAAKDAELAIAEGSFFRVLEPFKPEGHANLIEEVNQIRRYRNWVAHGRRGKRPERVDPGSAYERLSRFLQRVTPPD